MAEQEVVKHVKKVYKIWNSKEHSLWHKVREFLIEILIIVFAVSLSIWLHDRSEHNHQQKEVKEFLLGLREDLIADLNEMKGDKDSYLKQERAFKYITSMKRNQSLDNDSLKKYDTSIYNATRLQQNNGRFEGFKASGKIGAIEDKKLQNDIMDLYQENIPSLLVSTDSYIHWKNQLLDFKIKNYRRTSDSTSNNLTLWSTDEAQSISSFLDHPDEILTRYDFCIDKMKTIVSEIEKEYDIESGK